jgi:hypothetical protein
MKTVLWFSRHKMSDEQRNDLERICREEIAINQISKTINSAKEIVEEIKISDVVCIVAPIHLQKQFLELAGWRPVLTAVSERIIKTEDGEEKVEFKFKNWLQLHKIEIITEVL